VFQLSKLLNFPIIIPTHIVHHCGKRKEVEKVGEVLPHARGAVDSQALVIEPVNLRDLAALVIATSQRNAIRIPNLERDKQKDAVQRVIAAINVVAEKEIIVQGRLATNLEQLEKIEKLPVHCKLKYQDSELRFI